MERRREEKKSTDEEAICLILRPDFSAGEFSTMFPGAGSGWTW